MLNLLWGVKAQFYDKMVSTDETVEDLNKMTVERGYAQKGDFVINLTSMPVHEKGMVNTLRVSQV
jgi:pyruvate kinase